MARLHSPAGVRTNARPREAFGHIHRSFDQRAGRWCARLLPGEYCVSGPDELLTTVLGSCVSACVRDPALEVGGMNHFMLPEDTTSGQSSWLEPSNGHAHRYGSFAMEALINDLLKIGARRERLEIKLVGGARILASMTDIGLRNIEFVRKWLRMEGLEVAGEDVGGTRPRRVVYDPVTGLVSITRLRGIVDRDVALSEAGYRSRLRIASTDNDVEFFNS
jgi:chemotaxis protein CheD